MRRHPIIAAAVLALLAMAPSARAAQRVRLHASLYPNRLGASTTIGFAFTIAGTGPSGVPAPLRAIDLHFPGGMSLGSSTLGLAYCQPAPLLTDGLESCSRNAVLGYGSGAVKVATSQGVVSERAAITALLGPPNPQHVEVLFYAEAVTPIAAQLVFPGAVLDDQAPYGTLLDTTIPLISTWPGGPDVSVTNFSSTVGPKNLTYSERVGGRTIRFQPTGIKIPRTCPRGGFPFAAELRFVDGSEVRTRTSVRCPRG
jgi:hypothetical protein